MAKEKWFIKEKELDNDQHKIKDLNPKKSYSIQGCAGSGKTILALWKAKFHQENGDDYILIVYTAALKKFIEDGVLDLGIESKRILTFDAWQLKGGHGADFIIVDEAQDFSESEILKLQSMAKVSIMFFGDTIQQLYPKKIKTNEDTISMQKISQITNTPLWTLMKNYRLPKTIARMAQKIPKLQDNLEAKCVNQGTEIPVVTKFGSQDAELDFIIQTIRKGNLTDVGILLSTNEDVKRVNDYFSKHGLECEAKYQLKNSAPENELDFVTNNPKIVTYHSSKGLQFEVVFIPFCETDNDFFRTSLYVGATRPYKQLYFTYTNRLSAFINAIPQSLYKLTTDIPPNNDQPLLPF